MTEVDKKRLAEIQKMELKSGSHKSIEDGGCVMELVSWIAGEKYSDHPACACPILTEYAIRINDKFKNEDRQKLKPLIPKLVNTRADEATQILRKQFIMFRNITATYPALLDLIQCPELPGQLRALKNTGEDMEKAKTLLWGHQKSVRKRPHADAKKARSLIADIMVETLRQACEIRNEPR